MPTGPAQNYMRQAFHGSNNQASHGNPWLRRIPGRAGMCSARGPESVRASVMSARAASRCISCQTGCIGSNYRPCGTSVESHCSTGMHPLLSIKAPHPEAAKLFVDWAMSKRGQAWYQTNPNLYYGSVRTDAPPMPTGVRLGDLKLLYPADWDDYAANRDVFAKEWNGMLGL